MEFRTKLSVNWRLKQEKKFTKTVRLNVEKVKNPKEQQIYQSKIANSFRENKITIGGIETTWTNIKDTVSRVAKTIQENDRKYRNHWFDTTCQEVIRKR